MSRYKKIVVIGPESTGKSTLCTALAQQYHTRWVPEYAREYLLQHGTHYSYDDLLTIAKGQLALEDTIMDQLNKEKNTSQFIFIDTDMYVMKVWSEYVFDKCHQWIIDTIAERPYDLYLLCNIDLAWTPDELREYPDYKTREKLFHIYKDLLIHQRVPWALISGTNEERLQNAIRAIDNQMK